MPFSAAVAKRAAATAAVVAAAAPAATAAPAPAAAPAAAAAAAAQADRCHGERGFTISRDFINLLVQEGAVLEEFDDGAGVLRSITFFAGLFRLIPFDIV